MKEERKRPVKKVEDQPSVPAKKKKADSTEMTASRKKVVPDSAEQKTIKRTKTKASVKTVEAEVVETKKKIRRTEEDTAEKAVGRTTLTEEEKELRRQRREERKKQLQASVRGVKKSYRDEESPEKKTKKPVKKKAEEPEETVIPKETKKVRSSKVKTKKAPKKEVVTTVVPDEVQEQASAMFASVEKASSILFGVLVVAGMILGLLIPLRPTVSEKEKRNLTEFPTFQTSDFLSGAYTSGISEWYADSFPLRDMWMSVDEKIKALYGIKTMQVVGGDASMAGRSDELAAALAEQQAAQQEAQTEAVGQEPAQPVETEAPAETEKEFDTAALYDLNRLREDAAAAVQRTQSQGLILVGNAAYSAYYFNKEAADDYIKILNYLGDNLAGYTSVENLLVPPSSEFYLEQDIIDSMYGTSAKDSIAYYYGGMNTNVKTIDAYSALEEHKDEYIFYRTDHHWTAVGAYYAYDAWSKRIREMPGDPLTQYQQLTFPGFVGSYYSLLNSQVLADNPDDVVVFVPSTTNEITITDMNGSTYNDYVINDAIAWDPPLKYNAFINGDNPYSIVINPVVQNGKTCVLVKDSYGNCFAPYLVDDYQKLIIIDYRSYEGNLIDLCMSENVTDLLVLHSMESISDVTVTKLLGEIVYK